jgi:hypothetical protein
MQFRRTETLQGKIRNEGKARRWREKDNSILICKCVTDSCPWVFVQLTTECSGLILLTLSMKVTLTGSLSVTPRGTCGVVIASSKNGDL